MTNTDLADARARYDAALAIPATDPTRTAYIASAREELRLAQGRQAVADAAARRGMTLTEVTASIVLLSTTRHLDQSQRAHIYLARKAWADGAFDLVIAHELRDHLLQAKARPATDCPF
ncbi:MAG: hypothetical protein RR101_15440 [Burkholderiaceae bacterium]